MYEPINGRMSNNVFPDSDGYIVLFYAQVYVGCATCSINSINFLNGQNNIILQKWENESPRNFSANFASCNSWETNIQD